MVPPLEAVVTVPDVPTSASIALPPWIPIVADPWAEALPSVHVPGLKSISPWTGVFGGASPIQWTVRIWFAPAPTHAIVKDALANRPETACPPIVPLTSIWMSSLSRPLGEAEAPEEVGRAVGDALALAGGLGAAGEATGVPPPQPDATTSVVNIQPMAAAARGLDPLLGTIGSVMATTELGSEPG